MLEENTQGNSAPEFTGMAARINEQIEVLTTARDVAVTLESGLDTQIGIRAVSVQLRNILLTASRDIHGLFGSVLYVRSELLTNIGTVIQAKKKAFLEEKISKMQGVLSKLI